MTTRIETMGGFTATTGEHVTRRPRGLSLPIVITPNPGRVARGKAAVSRPFGRKAR